MPQKPHLREHIPGSATFHNNYFTSGRNTYLPQHTLSGHSCPETFAFLPHSAFASQLDQQTSFGEIPDVPQALRGKPVVSVIGRDSQVRMEVGRRNGRLTLLHNYIGQSSSDSRRRSCKDNQARMSSRHPLRPGGRIGTTASSAQQGKHQSL